MYDFPCTIIYLLSILSNWVGRVSGNNESSWKWMRTVSEGSGNEMLVAGVLAVNCKWSWYFTNLVDENECQVKSTNCLLNSSFPLMPKEAYMLANLNRRGQLALPSRDWSRFPSYLLASCSWWLEPTVAFISAQRGSHKSLERPSHDNTLSEASNGPLHSTLQNQFQASRIPSVCK